jgi:hypothetical protein
MSFNQRYEHAGSVRVVELLPEVASNSVIVKAYTSLRKGLNRGMQRGCSERFDKASGRV